MILRLAPYLTILILSLTAYGLWQRGKVLTMERDAAQAEVKSFGNIVEAEKKLRVELSKLRADYEKQQRKLRAIPDDGCLDRPIPDDLRLLLAPADQAPDATGTGQAPGPDNER